MNARIAHAAAALTALILGAAALRIAWAERAYDRGLALATDPKASAEAPVPGRLEAYEEAARRDPGEALYALRAGQLRVRAAAESKGATRGAEAAAARAHLDAALRATPLDPTLHVARAKLARVVGDTESALAEAALAVRLGPRARGELALALSIGLGLYAERHDPRGLTLALRASTAFVAMGEKVGTHGAGGRVAATVKAAGPDIAADLLEATAGDAELRRAAAEFVRDARPDVADALAAFAGAPPR